jgi:hypothetical protein
MAKTLPSDIYTFLVADSVREEAGSNKVTVIGGMTGGNILLKDAKFPAGIPLAILISFRDGEGTFVAKFRVFDPKGRVMGQEFDMGTVTKEAKKTMQILVNFGVVFPIPMVGNYRVEVQLDDRIYHDSFSVETAP